MVGWWLRAVHVVAVLWEEAEEEEEEWQGGSIAQAVTFGKPAPEKMERRAVARVPGRTASKWRVRDSGHRTWGLSGVACERGGWGVLGCIGIENSCERKKKQRGRT